MVLDYVVQQKFGEFLQDKHVFYVYRGQVKPGLRGVLGPLGYAQIARYMQIKVFWEEKSKK